MAIERVSFDSPYYPYKKVISGANTLRGAEIVPYKMFHYLLDLPDSEGYVPVDDNDRPRVRLAKYLWYDTANPLSMPLPTPDQKLSMLYDPRNPAVNTDEEKAKHPKGYRLYVQRNVNQSVIEAKTIVKIYPGRIIDETDFRTILTFNIEIWANYALITNTKTTAYDRTFDIEQCIREALVGVDIDGVGVVHATRVGGSYNGSEFLYTDSLECGRLLYVSVAWQEGGGGIIHTY